MRVLKNRESAAHPGVNVALYVNHLRLVVFRNDRRRTRRLRLIPLLVNFGERMNIVRSLIIVGDLQLLIGLKRQHVREYTGSPNTD